MIKGIKPWRICQRQSAATHTEVSGSSRGGVEPLRRPLPSSLHEDTRALRLGIEGMSDVMKGSANIRRLRASHRSIPKMAAKTGSPLDMIPPGTSGTILRLLHGDGLPNPTPTHFRSFAHP
jgi:hypothetical protein